MGRGERSNPFPALNTPGPGAYEIYRAVPEPKTRKRDKSHDPSIDNVEVEHEHE